MKKLYAQKFLLVLLLLISITGILNAQNFNLIDINTLKSSNPSNYNYSGDSRFAVINGVFYFSADDGVHGVELYSSDGTAAGTKLVKDINPGTVSSSPRNIIVSNNKLYFIASVESNYEQLWVSDGTANGTKQLSALSYDAGYYSSFLLFLTDADGVVYYVVNFQQLWKTDGTPEGTVLVTDYTYTGSVEKLANVNGVLFFSLGDYYNGAELYKSDGTTEGTTLVKDINPFGSSNPSQLTAVNGLLYFAADDGAGARLWVSDGTESGTKPVNNDQNISVQLQYGFGNNPFAVRDGVLFFQGVSPDAGSELCSYNTKNAAAGVTLVKDIILGATGSNPINITDAEGALFFSIQPEPGNSELWKTDGTAAGTVLVKDVYPGGVSYYGSFTNAGGTLFFNANNELGSELWKSDGTAAGTVLVEDIYPGAKSSGPYFLTYSNGILLFAATKAAKGGELWKSDGTEAGTLMVKDINTATNGGSYPRSFAEAGNNKVIFWAQDQNHYGLWATDGSAAGTDFLKTMYFYIPPASLKNNAVVAGETDSGTVLLRTDGTKAGTKIFYSFNGYRYILKMAATDNLVYLWVFNDVNGQFDLWRTNGTANGTYVLKANVVDNYSSSPAGVGNTLFFNNYDDEHGYELWKSDGTADGTTLVKDIVPGTESSNPSNLYNFNGKLFFSALNAYYYVLYNSDGTETGTELVKYIAVNSNLAEANGKLFFYGFSVLSTGSELYATDGTGPGTYLVKDIAKGPSTSYGYGTLYGGDTLIYFIADDLKHGSELWRSSGTREGTFLLKNIAPGNAGIYLYAPGAVNVNDHFSFAIYDTLWQSDGTKQGTHRVYDNTVEGVSQIFELSAAHNKVYFAGYTYAAGRELYAGDVSSSSGSIQSVAANDLTALNSNAFDAKLLTNPVINELKFTVHVKKQQEAQVIIMDASGRILRSEKQKLSQGINMFSYNIKEWMQGMYMIRIITTNGSAVLLKAVK